MATRAANQARLWLDSRSPSARGTARRWLDGRPVAEVAPLLSVVPSALALGTTTVGTPSTPQTYVLTGSNLTASVTVTAPANVEVSSDGAAYHASLTLTPSAGSVSATIWVRIIAAAPVGPVSGSVRNTSTGATEQDVAVSGTVVAVPVPTMGGGATLAELLHVDPMRRVPWGTGRMYGETQAERNRRLLLLAQRIDEDDLLTGVL